MAIDLVALAKFDTPTICNTIELFEVRPRTAGYMDGRVRACFPEMAPAVGYAEQISAIESPANITSPPTAPEPTTLGDIGDDAVNPRAPGRRFAPLLCELRRSSGFEARRFS